MSSERELPTNWRTAVEEIAAWGTSMPAELNDEAAHYKAVAFAIIGYAARAKAHILDREAHLDAGEVKCEGCDQWTADAIPTRDGCYLCPKCAGGDR